MKKNFGLITRYSLQKKYGDAVVTDPRDGEVKTVNDYVNTGGQIDEGIVQSISEQVVSAPASGGGGSVGSAGSGGSIVDSVISTATDFIHGGGGVPGAAPAPPEYAQSQPGGGGQSYEVIEEIEDEQGPMNWKILVGVLLLLAVVLFFILRKK